MDLEKIAETLETITHNEPSFTTRHPTVSTIGLHLLKGKAIDLAALGAEAAIKPVAGGRSGDIFLTAYGLARLGNWIHTIKKGIDYHRNYGKWYNQERKRNPEN